MTEAKTPLELKQTLSLCCDEARRASRELAKLDRSAKDEVLLTIAQLLEERAAELIAVNLEDLAEARDAGLGEALLDRLVLDAEGIASLAAGVREIASFDDPVGEVVGMGRRPNGLMAGRVRVPLGVIAMVYESRPNVTVDAAALCLKSGNAVLLRGGKEAKRSNQALGEVVRQALSQHGLMPDAVQIVPPMGREATKTLLGMHGQIDLLIPRGGEGLIRFVAEHARVPVVQHYKGVCHLYVDEGADIDMALRLIENGKMSRPGVCNALECILIHRAEAPALVPHLNALIDQGLQIRSDAEVAALLPRAKPAHPDDFGHEFLSKVLAARIVDDLGDAINHISRYGSQHTESICTSSYEHSERFLREVDASCVLVNASTRFNDGSMLGLGAEVGISTTKLHAYGPMGLSSLTSLKWVVRGHGQVR